MLINLLENIKNDSEIPQKIFNSFKEPFLSFEEIKRLYQQVIPALNAYLKDNNQKIFLKVSNSVLRNIEIQNINFENIIKAFNLFITEFLKTNIKKLTIDEIKEFINAVIFLLISIVNVYNKKLSAFNERILNNISSGVIILDNNLNILKANRKFYEILGDVSQNIIGRNLKEVLSNREGIPIEKLKNICLSQKKLNETGLFIKRQNGKKYHRTIYADTLFNEQNIQEGFIVYIRDTDYLHYLKDTFSKYLSRQVAEKILNEKDIKLKGERKKVAVMFVDIRNFTKFSENHPPEYVIEKLNSYFNKIIDVVFEFQGTLDKFIGDAAMIVFGAPIEMKNYIESCLDCAIEIQKRISTIDEEVNFKLGIGINYGEVVVGNIGSEKKRLEYTVIGDTVNTAQRVEKMTPGGKIYITENVFSEIKNLGKYNLKFIGPHKFKGKSRPVNIYEIIFQ